MNDFPQVIQQSNKSAIFYNNLHSDVTEFELRKEKQFPEKPVNLSKKRKLAITDSNVDLTNLRDKAERNSTFLSDNPNCSQQLDSGNLDIHTSLCDGNKFKKEMLESNNDMFVYDENLSNTMLQSQDQNFQDW